jgi:predicted ATPase
MLRELLGPPDDARILFVGTIRTDQPTLLPSALVRGLDGISTLALQPLDGADAHALVEALWPGADPRDVRRVIAQAGGHPLFMRELCLSRVASRDALGDALRGRAEAMPRSTRALLEVIALAGDALPQDLAGAAAGLSWAETESALALLRAAQLARTVGLRRTDLVEIAHDRVRDAVIATVLLPVRKRLHRELAVTLERWPRVAARTLADHWIEAGEPAQARERLLVGAERAAEALAFAQAISLYRHALPLCDEAQRRMIEDKVQTLEQLQSRREER